MFVKAARKMSSLKEVTNGVLLGTVLGAILFLFYVNCFAYTVDCCWKDFTEDFKLYFNFPEVLTF